MGYSDPDVSDYMYSSKPQLNKFVDYLCKDLTRACSTKPPSVPKLILWVNLANEGMLRNGGADGGTLSFRICLLEYTGGEFVWMRPKWLRAMLLQRQKWLCDCILSIAGVSQGLPFNVDLMTQILAIQSRLESFETWQARLEAIERGVPPPEDDRDRLHLHVDSSTTQFHWQQAQDDLENVARLKEVVARLEMENEQLRRSQTCDQTQPQPSTNHFDSDSDH